jgi:hypothetical protein
MHGHFGCQGELGRQDRDRDGILEHSEVIATMTQGPAAGCWQFPRRLTDDGQLLGRHSWSERHVSQGQWQCAAEEQ